MKYVKIVKYMESKSRMVVNMDFGEKEILFFDGYKVLVK
jgi:hypothetical protein